MLSVKERQARLKKLGYYTGAIDGSNGTLTKQAVLNLQKDYFTRSQDHDGSYGYDTDKLLKNVWYAKDLTYFKLSEFKCSCGQCTGYPSEIDPILMRELDNLRAYYGKSITITSGLRCTYRNKQVGGSSESGHLTGKACDI